MPSDLLSNAGYVGYVKQFSFFFSFECLIIYTFFNIWSIGQEGWLECVGKLRSIMETFITASGAEASRNPTKLKTCHKNQWEIENFQFFLIIEQIFIR